MERLGVGYVPLERRAKEWRQLVVQALEEGSKPDDYMAYDGSTALVMAATYSRPVWKTLTWRRICFSAEMTYISL